MEKLIIKIANYYGKENQVKKCVEEMAELTVALMKHQNDENIFDIIQEIADVEIMISQMKYLFEIEDFEVEGQMKHKINRQLIRIAEMEGEN